MDNVRYLAFARAASLAQQTEIIANNMANANKSGFLATRTSFESIVRKTEGDTAEAEITYGVDARTWNDRTGGGLLQTDNPLDLAVQGDGWFGYEDANGNISLSRDGALTVNAEGSLVNVDGALLLDAGGGQINLPDGGAGISISSDGSILSAEGDLIAQIGIFSGEGLESWSRDAGSMFRPGGEDAPLEILEGGRLVQGFIEQSNVNPILEMTKLIKAQRAFDQSLNMAESANELRAKTIEAANQA
jgi:flagellar basal-body rod protein FlgF